MRRFIVYPNMKTACVTALLLAAFVAGCAELRWHKDGADAAALERDLAACQQVARQRALHEAWPLGLATTHSSMNVDVLGRPVAPYPTRLETDRFLLEHDLTRFCMRERGYDLVPAGTRNAK